MENQRAEAKCNSNSRVNTGAIGSDASWGRGARRGTKKWGNKRQRHTELSLSLFPYSLYYFLSVSLSHCNFEDPFSRFATATMTMTRDCVGWVVLVLSSDLEGRGIDPRLWFLTLDVVFLYSFVSTSRSALSSCVYLDEIGDNTNSFPSHIWACSVFPATTLSRNNFFDRYSKSETGVRRPTFSKPIHGCGR